MTTVKMMNRAKMMRTNTTMLAMALMTTSDDNDVDRVTTMKKKYVGDDRMTGPGFYRLNRKYTNA